MAELEEEKRELEEQMKIKDEIAKKEKILELSRSHSRDKSAKKASPNMVLKKQFD